MTNSDVIGMLAAWAHLREFNFLSEQALENIAQMVIEMCRGYDDGDTHWAPRQQANWIIQEVARVFDEYPGPATIREVFNKRFPAPGTPYAPSVELKRSGPDMTPAELAEWQAENDRLWAKLKEQGVTKNKQMPSVPKQPTMSEAELRAEIDRIKQEKAKCQNG